MMRRACRVTPSASACRGRIGRAQIDLPALCPGRRPFTPLPFVNGHKSGPTPRRPPERKTWLLLSPALKYGCLAPDVPVNWRSALRQFPLRHPRPASRNRTRRRVKGAARCAIGVHRRKRIDLSPYKGWCCEAAGSRGRAGSRVGRRNSRGLPPYRSGTKSMGVIPFLPFSLVDQHSYYRCGKSGGG
jgi:hypothetical protein